MVQRKSSEEQGSRHDFDIPLEWMIDGTWEKGATKQDLSCMVGKLAQSIDKASVEVITKTVEQAKILDQRLQQTLPVYNMLAAVYTKIQGSVCRDECQ